MELSFRPKISDMVGFSGGSAPKRGPICAKFHDYWCHRRRDICNWTERNNIGPTPPILHTNVRRVVSVAARLPYVSRSRMRVQTRPVSTVLSGQSTPHMIRSRVTHHVIQSATLATFQVRSKCM